MSVIVEIDGKKILYTKGADSIILKLLQNKNLPSVKSVTENVDRYALVGLRTLLLAKREIPEEEFEEWRAHYAVSTERDHWTINSNV